MAEPKPKAEPAKTGWYRDEKTGQLCFEGSCFGLRADADLGTFEVQFDEQCDVQEASQAERALMRNVMERKGVAYRRRRRGE